MKRLILVALTATGCATLEIRAKNGDHGAMAEMVLGWALEAEPDQLTAADVALPLVQQEEAGAALRQLVAMASRPDPVRKGAAKALALKMADTPGGLEKCVAEEQEALVLEACMAVAGARNIKIAEEVLKRLSTNAAASVASAARRLLGIGNPLAGLKGAAEGGPAAKEAPAAAELPPWMRGRAPDSIFERHPRRRLPALSAMLGAKKEEKTPAQKRREALESALRANDILPVDKPHLVAALDDSDRTVRSLAAAALLALGRKQ